PAGRDRASTRTSPSGRGLHRRLGRSTGHPGRASTTPEMSATGPDGWAEPVPAWRTPHERLPLCPPAPGPGHPNAAADHQLEFALSSVLVCRPPPEAKDVVRFGESAP